MTSPDDGRPLTIEQVAEWLSVSVPTVYRLLRSGRLGGAKVGGQWRIPRVALMELLEDRISDPEPSIVPKKGKRRA